MPSANSRPPVVGIGTGTARPLRSRCLRSSVSHARSIRSQTTAATPSSSQAPPRVLTWAAFTGRQDGLPGAGKARHLQSHSLGDVGRENTDENVPAEVSEALCDSAEPAPLLLIRLVVSRIEQPTDDPVCPHLRGWPLADRPAGLIGNASDRRLCLVRH